MIAVRGVGTDCRFVYGHHGENMAELPDRIEQWHRLDYVVVNFPEMLSEVSIKTVEVCDGDICVARSVRTGCLDMLGYRAGEGSSQVLGDGMRWGTVQLGDVKVGPEGLVGSAGLELCACLSGAFSFNDLSRSMVRWALGDLCQVDSVCRELENCLPLSPGGASLIISAQRMLTRLLSDTAREPTVTPANAGESAGALMELLRDRGRDLLAQAQANLESDAQREHTLEQIAIRLVGKAKFGSYALDDTPVIVGLLSYSDEGEMSEVDLLIAQFGQRYGAHVILELPLYAAQWLVRRDEGSVAPMASLGSGDTPGVVDIAAALWDPDGSGELASLRGCLEVARAV